MSRALIIIFGPTASGKSALALAVAEAFAGSIVNADSMQIYRELPILTACPEAADRARVPHRLYGALSAAEPCSAGRWLDLAKGEIEAVWGEGRLAVVVGGTGLYLQALRHGIAPVPDIPDAIRARARALFAEGGIEGVRAELTRIDASMAQRLRPEDSQRQTRALEVMWATGRSLADWQSEPQAPPFAVPSLAIAVAPSREQVYAACDARLAGMIERGALDEVRATLHLDEALPAMKALGVPDLRRLIRGEIGAGEALSRAQRATRQYAKRQMTWMRHRFDREYTMNTQFSERFCSEIIPFIRSFLLTTEI